MIYRPTLSFSLFLSLSPCLSLWRTDSPSFFLFSPLFWLGEGFESYVSVVLLKTLFLFMFRKVCKHVNIHPVTQFQVYPLSNKCHMNTPFLRVRCQTKKLPTSHANTLYAMTLSLRSKKKQRDNVVFGKPMGRSLMIFNATNPLKVCVCVSCWERESVCVSYLAFRQRERVCVRVVCVSGSERESVCVSCLAFW